MLRFQRIEADLRRPENKLLNLCLINQIYTCSIKRKFYCSL